MRREINITKHNGRQVRQAAQRAAEKLTGENWEHLSPHLQENVTHIKKQAVETATRLGNSIVMRGDTAFVITIVKHKSAKKVLQTDTSRRSRTDSESWKIAAEHCRTTTSPIITDAKSEFITAMSRRRVDGSLEIVTQKYIKTNATIGDLTLRTEEMNEDEFKRHQETDRHERTFHTYVGCEPRYFCKQAQSDLIWNIRNNSSTPNCIIRADGRVTALRDIWPLETLTADYAAMLPAVSPRIRGGEEDNAVTAQEEQHKIDESLSQINAWNPDKGATVLWEHTMKLCHGVNEKISIGEAEIHSRQADIAGTLQCLHTGKRFEKLSMDVLTARLCQTDRRSQRHSRHLQ